MSGITKENGAARLSAVNEVALALSGQLDRRRLYEGIVHGLHRLLDAEVAFVASWDEGREELVVESSVGLAHKPHPFAPAEMPACVGRAFLERRTVSVDDLAAHPRASAASKNLELHAAVATPLLHDGRPLGVLAAGHRDAGQSFDAEDLQLLEILAGHVALAMVNAETLAAATRRLARVEEIEVSLRRVVEARTRQAVIERTLDCATTVLGADRAAIYLVDRELRPVLAMGRRISLSYLEQVAAYLPRSKGTVLWETRAPLHIPDLTRDARTQAINTAAVSEGVRSALLVPLVHRDEILGVLSLYHDLLWSWTGEEIAQVRTLTDQVALALVNAALHEQSAAQLAQLRVLDSLIRAISQNVPANERMTRGMHAMVAGGGASAASVYLVEDDRLALVAHAGVDPLGGSSVADIAGRAVESRRLVVHGITARTHLVAAPILQDDTVLGALVVLPPYSERIEARPGTSILDPGGDDPSLAVREFVATAAGQLATAVTNARLYQEAAGLGALLSAVIAELPDAVFVYDKNRRLVFYNRKVQEVYGLEGVDLKGWTPEDWNKAVAGAFADQSTRARIAAALHEDPRQVERMEFEVVRPRRRVIERIAAPVVGSDGKSHGQVILYHDLTELRNAERKRTNLLSIASHELRAPLGDARALVRERLRALARDGAGDKGFLELEGRLETVSLLVDDLFDAIQIEAGRFQLQPVRFDLREVLDDLAGRLRLMAAPRRVTVGSGTNAVSVYADEERLSRALAHFANVALGALPPDGSLDVGVESSGEQVAVLMTADPGPPMAAAFERLCHSSSGRDQLSALGLGLYVARTILQAHGGKMHRPVPNVLRIELAQSSAWLDTKSVRSA